MGKGKHVPELLHEGSTKNRRLGYTKKVAARFAKFFYVSMITTCGLFGLFFVIPQELFEPIAIVGQIHATPGMVLFLPATFIIRR